MQPDVQLVQILPLLHKFSGNFLFLFVLKTFFKTKDRMNRILKPILKKIITSY